MHRQDNFSLLFTEMSSNIGTDRSGFLRWWSVVEVVECGGVWRRRGGRVRRRSEEEWGGGVRKSGVEADRSGFLGRRKGSASLKIHGSASSLAHVIIICNDVTRASLNRIGQDLLSRHFFSVSPRVWYNRGIYNHSYSILLLLSSDFYNLAHRKIKNLILYEIAWVLYI